MAVATSHFWSLVSGGEIDHPCCRNLKDLDIDLEDSLFLWYNWSLVGPEMNSDMFEMKYVKPGRSVGKQPLVCFQSCNCNTPEANCANKTEGLPI